MTVCNHLAPKGMSFNNSKWTALSKLVHFFENINESSWVSWVKFVEHEGEAEACPFLALFSGVVSLVGRFLFRFTFRGRRRAEARESQATQAKQPQKKKHITWF